MSPLKTHLCGVVDPLDSGRGGVAHHSPNDRRQQTALTGVGRERRRCGSKTLALAREMKVGRTLGLAHLDVCLCSRVRAARDRATPQGDTYIFRSVSAFASSIARAMASLSLCRNALYFTFDSS